MVIVHVIESGGGSAEFMYYLTKYISQHKHIIIYSERTFELHIPEIKDHFGPHVTFYQWNHVQREINLRNDLRALKSLKRLFQHLTFDVVHLHSSKAGFLGRVACYLSGINRVIYTPNGLPFVRTDISSTKVRLFEALEKFAANLVGQIISCSKSEADALKQRGIPSSYIFNGTEIKDPFYPRFTSGKEKFRIVTTGRATIQKNPALFNKIAQAFETKPDIEFLWIGTGELNNAFSAKNIRVTGWLPRVEVLTHLEEADLYLSTASWEGLSFSVLEAMNQGKPLLLTRCIGNLDAVQYGENGFTFGTAEEAVEKIMWFVSHRELLGQMGNCSHQMCKKLFSAPAMAADYERVYAEVSSK